jgi:predicted Zn-dependent protease
MERTPMRKINVKLFVGLLIAAVVCAGTVFAVHYFQYQRIGKALLWQARDAEKKNDMERMARYLERYLEFNPRDLNEKAALGSLWAGEEYAAYPRKRQRGVQLLDQVINREPDRDDLRYLVIKASLDLRDYKLARSHLEKLWKDADLRSLSRDQLKKLPATRLEKLGELCSLMGQLAQGEEKPAEARRYFEDAIDLWQGEEESYVRLAYLIRGTEERDSAAKEVNAKQADVWMNQLVDRNEKSFKARLARWRYRREFNLLCLDNKPATGKIPLKEASEDVQKALELGPQEVLVLLAAADMERLTANAVLIDKDENLQREERERRAREHREKARQYLNDGLTLQTKPDYKGKSDGAQFQLLWHLAHLQLDELKDFKEGARDKRQALEKDLEETITRMRKTRGAPAAADYLQGRLLFAREQWAPAVELLEQARPVLQKQGELAAQIDLYLGQCYERLENPAQMYDAYKRILEYDPTSGVARLGMGTAMSMMGRLDEAIKELKKANDAEDVPAQGWLDFARLEMQRQLTQAVPDWKEVENALAKAEKLDPSSVELVLLRAELLYANKRAKDAEQLLMQKKQERPQQAEFWVALIELAERAKDTKTSQALLEKAEADANLRENVLIRLACARMLAKDKNEAAATKINDLKRGIEKLSPADQVRLLNGLADAQYRAGQVGEARHLWQEMSRQPLHETDMRLRLLLFDLALRDGDEPGMQEALDEIRAVEKGRGAFHGYALALRLIWQAKEGKQDKARALDAARQELNRATTQQPRWAAPCLALAEVEELSGSPEGAIKHLNDAIAKGENSPSVIRRLAEAHYNQGRYDEAAKDVERIQPSLQTDMGELIANILLHSSDPTRAVQIAREKPANGSKEFRDLLWRGMILGRVKLADPVKQQEAWAEAEKLLREAIACAEKEPAPRVALVQFLAARQRQAEAAEEIKALRAKLPADKVDLAEAQCYEALGRTDEARDRIEKLATKGRNDASAIRHAASFHLRDGDLAKAKTLLTRIVNGEVKAEESDREWARRSLAFVLANGTNFRDFQQALELVGLKLDEKGQLPREFIVGATEATESLRAKARVLATQPQRYFREKAIAMLEALSNRDALAPDDQFVLALLYEKAGAEQKSRQQMDTLVSKQTETPQYLARYVQMLIRKAEYDEAGRWIERLEVLEKQRDLPPNAYATVELRAILLESQGKGKGDDAIALLRKHINRRGAKPEEILLVIASYGRQKKFDEALAECEKAWKNKCPAELAGAASVAVLRDKLNRTEAELDRAETWLKGVIQEQEKAAANLKQNPKPPGMVLWLHLADLYDLRGQYAKAEKLLREVLTREPGNVIAMNNLAWMLAQQRSNGKEAEFFISKAVEAVGRRPDLLDTRGLVYLSQGRVAEALADLKEAVEDTPTPARLFHLARAYHENKDERSAAATLERAKELNLTPDKLHPLELDNFRELKRTYPQQLQVGG